MAEAGGAPASCRLGGAGAGTTPAPGRQCCGGGCGLGLARLVRRLRRRGRRALRAAAAASSQQQQRRRRACHQQYDPLSYARNFDLGDAARAYHGCSFSSRFVLVPTATDASATSSSSAAGDVVSAGAAPAAVASCN